MSHPYRTRFQAQAKQQQLQAKQQQLQEQQEQQAPCPLHAQRNPSAWYCVNVPTHGMYRYREEDIVRVTKEIKRILSNIEASKYSMESVVELFDYLMLFPFILIIRPSMGIAIQQKINDFKPVIAENQRRLTTFHTAHETMVKSLATSDSHVQKAGMHLLREYETFQKEMARWMHLKDIMEKLERIMQ